MKIYIGHNGHDAKSRAFVAANQDNPAVVDVLDYLYELGPFTNYQGFPFVGVIMDDGTQHTLYNPATWDDVEAWLASLSGTVRIEFTKLEFLNLFTDEEKISLKALEATDPTVALFWEEYRTADTIRLDDPRTIRAIEYLSAQGYLAAGRKEAILGL